MHRSTLKWVAVVASIIAISASGRAQNDQVAFRHFPTPLTASRNIPLDVDERRVDQFDKGGQIGATQREFDILAWQAFLALNWPATSHGGSDSHKGLNDNTTDRVWSAWRPSQTIFRPGGVPPEPWRYKEGEQIDLTKAKAAWRQHVSSTDENLQAFSGPLVDQNGNWARYEVRVNDVEFQYLQENHLYNLEGQAAYVNGGHPISFPVNEHGHNGAIEIKLAWKELTPADDRSRFFVRHVVATLSEPLQSTPPMREFDAGLVGMHISMRTQSSPEWVWATFEQADNLRPHTGSDGKQYKANFNNGDPNIQLVNTLPPRNAVIDPNTGYPIPVPAGGTPTTWIESLTKTPVQVVRINVPPQPQLNDHDAALAQTTAALNAEVQGLLKQAGSVFQYYELIGTQWPLDTRAPAYAGGQGSAPESIRFKMQGEMMPVFLINTTMETYFQKGSQPAGPLEQDDRLADGAPPIDSTPVVGTESCVGCHYSAGAGIGFKKNADASLKIENGQKVPIYGENGNFGQNGNAHFSWLLQIEARSQLPQPAVAPAAAPAAQLRRQSTGLFLDTTHLNAGSSVEH
jgi:hypothetical protein